ncbi:MAG: sulfatase-like hydrolase/transferase [Planctomycetes bacterium]|nr:sulfatase-like hydrolase/transferase [Planctomycetota bacterium]MCB9885979.1 sulfatase-like hydrolase/transferase [Planctomycetota bacterium]
MSRRRALRLPLLLGIACALTLAAPVVSQDKPNVVIFLADDLGYGDLGCYGHPILETPNLDAFAAAGVRLTDCHAAGTVCSPSRAGLLTGRTPYRLGFYTIAGPERSHLRAQEVTLATLLKAQGYDTCFVGKWHLGDLDPASGQPGPGEHGFDHWFATQVNAFDGPDHPGKFVRNGVKVGPVDAWYCDAIVAEAVGWMKARPDQKRPFFLLVCSHEPHTPIRPPQAYSDRYADAAVAELEKTMPYGQVHRPLQRAIRDNAKYYYGTVTQLDDAFGRLMKGLDDQGHRDDSLVIFTSDNGPETPVTVEESGNQWQDPIRDRCFGTPGPFRGMKRFVYEGGHRVPGIVRWPGHIPAGSLSGQLINGTDWLPTICAVTGAALPQDRVIDGIDAMPGLSGQPLVRPTPACWMFPVGYDYRYLPSMAMRDGDHVMIGWFEPKRREQGNSAWVRSTQLTRFVLYDLAVDIAERHELNDAEPEVFARLRERMIAHWREVQAEAPDWPALGKK